MEVKIWKEKIIIPTYKTGAPDKNPMFLEKRVYQGSSGVVYPYPVIDKVFDEKEEREWTALFLENDYLKVMILPELGGRIQMAYDKTNDYHFVYHNRVIKPALVGLAGPWISGGIEFNWPQHHRPNTFGPTDYMIVENKDGSKTVWVNEYEMMFGTKCALGFTLYPDKAYIELHAKLYNRSPFPQTFLWWANPAVSVDEHYQSVFPPDVHAVFDHGKRDVSAFPIATGTYYKVDYSPGTDISVYTNIPVPTSYMAVNSAFDFVGGYHHQKKAGIMHIANHHVSPGKKQWTWGCGDFGKAWDRQLTDEDGPYFELMCGVYTDNQPDFGWIMPNEAREFKQYFMPYKNIGYVKNASIDAMVNLETVADKLLLKVYITQKRKVTIQLQEDAHILLQEQVELSPLISYEKELAYTAATPDKKLYVTVKDATGNVLVDYTPVNRQGTALPDPAAPIPLPADITTIEELFLAGQHLEQYRHATYSPLDYYNEALRRDATDIRCNNAKGLWYLRRGAFGVAEPFLRAAVEKSKKHNPNPYDGEPLYNLGLCLKYQQQYNEAYDLLFKSTWNAGMQDVAYLQLGYIAALQNRWQDVHELAEKSILRNYHGLKARHLKTIALRKTGRLNEAIKLCEETIAIDGFDFASQFELSLCLAMQGDNTKSDVLQSRLKDLMRGCDYTYIEIATQYADAGLYADAITLLQLHDQPTSPMHLYYLGYFSIQAGKVREAARWFAKAFDGNPDRVFPNRMEDIGVLRSAIAHNPSDYKAWYYLGNYYYAKRLYEPAREAWEQSVAINNQFPTALRNLGIAYYNKFDKKEAALQLYKKAFEADKTDSRVLFELDQLQKRFKTSPQERLFFLDSFKQLVEERDDLYIEYVGLHSLTGQFDTAYELLMQRNFHPWEGGEGKTSFQYVQVLIEQAKHQLSQNNPDQAIELLTAAQHYPYNLGEGKIFGAQENDIFYWLGCAYQAKGNDNSAREAWEKAAVGLSEPAPAIYYNDQQPDKIFYQALALLKLERTAEANERFEKLIHYGKEHEQDHIRIDFFAVSLPDLMIFDDDLDIRNKIHCHYLIGLGYKGLGKTAEAQIHLSKVLEMDPAHWGARLHLS
ncbi:MAG: DUF5107 domain-containing protein [Niabella sp.]|nr:DUF5107 domain-containing protein [Niabella sp.]